MGLESLLSIIQFSGILFLLYNGTFIKTKYFNYAKIFISIMIISALFRIMHWEGFQVLSLISITGVIVVYYLSFSKKPIKKILDYLKLFWVVLYYSLTILKLNHLIKSELLLIPEIIVVLALVEYARKNKV